MLYIFHAKIGLLGRRSDAFRTFAAVPVMTGSH